MRPSIMSLGATMSTPAPAWVSACLHQHFHGRVVHDVAVFGRAGVGQAILAVGGEGVQRHVGHHAQIREFFFQPAPRGAPSHRGSALRGHRRFERLVNHREQGHHRNAQLDAVFGHRQQQSRLRRSTPGMEADGFALLLAINNKNRVNQVVRRECVFAHQVAGKGVAAQAARAPRG
jgi:hypothetical protein